MVNIYRVSNSDEKTNADLNEYILLDCIKLAKHRNKKLYDRLVDIWEQLNNKTFDEDRELDY